MEFMGRILGQLSKSVGGIVRIILLYIDDDNDDDVDDDVDDDDKYDDIGVNKPPIQHMTIDEVHSIR